MKQRALITGALLVLAIAGVWFGHEAANVRASNDPPLVSIATPDQAQPGPITLKKQNFVYLAPDGQIMAKSSSPKIPSETSWERKGYTRTAVTAVTFEVLTRNHKMVADGQGGWDITESMNPEPVIIVVPDMSQASIEARFNDGSYTAADLVAYLKIKHGF